MKNAPERKPISHAVLETVLYATDLDAAATFYGDVLGLPLVSAEPGRHLFFRIGQGMLLIFHPDETAESTVMVQGNRIPPHGSRGAGHIAFQLEPRHSDELIERLADAGTEVESTIQWPGKRGQSIYCRDPAGNSIEFAPSSLWNAH